MPASRPVLIDEDTDVVDAVDEIEASHQAFVAPDADDENVSRHETPPNIDAEDE